MRSRRLPPALPALPRDAFANRIRSFSRASIRDRNPGHVTPKQESWSNARGAGVRKGEGSCSRMPHAVRQEVRVAARETAWASSGQ